MIQSVREADTLAAEWHLPREWERRAGPETSRGRHHPKRFSLGLHPVSLGKTKEMGWNMQHKVKTTKSKTASSSNPKTHTKTPGKLSLAGGGHSVLLQQTFTIQPRVSGTLPHWMPVSSSYRRCVTGPILLSAMMWSLSL